MQQTFQLPYGVKTTHLDGVHEGHTVIHEEKYDYIYANVSAEKLENFLSDSIAIIGEPGFFILEVPLDEYREIALRANDKSPFHYDVFYLNGQSVASLKRILNGNQELLINDGMSRFGFSSHLRTNEMMLENFKTVVIYTTTLDEFQSLFKKYGIPQEKDLKTAADTITRETPGETEIITVNGCTIYDLVDELAVHGLYQADTREEK